MPDCLKNEHGFQAIQDRFMTKKRAAIYKEAMAETYSKLLEKRRINKAIKELRNKERRKKMNEAKGIKRDYVHNLGHSSFKKMKKLGAEEDDEDGLGSSVQTYGGANWKVTRKPAGKFTVAVEETEGVDVADLPSEEDVEDDPDEEPYYGKSSSSKSKQPEKTEQEDENEEEDDEDDDCYFPGEKEAIQAAQQAKSKVKQAGDDKHEDQCCK